METPECGYTHAKHTLVSMISHFIDISEMSCSSTFRQHRNK